MMSVFFRGDHGALHFRYTDTRVGRRNRLRAQHYADEVKRGARAPWLTHFLITMMFGVHRHAGSLKTRSQRSGLAFTTA